MNKFLLMSTFIAVFPGNTFAMYEGGGSANPLQNLDYYEVSNLRKIQKKYKPLMEKQGCAGNLCLENDHEQRHTAGGGCIQEMVQSGLNQLRELNNQLSKLWNLDDQTDDLVKYQNECLEHLQHVRNVAILRPAYEAGIQGALLGGSTTICNYLDPGSLGSSISLYSTISTCAFYANSAIRAGYTYYNPPSHPVDALEKQYIQNQCFIPNQLWPGIMEKLMVARQNPYEQRQALHYLSFTLGLTLYKAEQPLVVQQLSPDEVIPTILNRFNQFFEDYEPFKNSLDKSILRTNVKCFLQNYFGEGQQKPRPLFIYGPGGIGKTHFASEFVKWIEEILPNSISYESIKITSPEELEGSESRPGVFLQVLRNKCSQGTRASVVLMDEADWLNKPEFEAPTKRTINGDLSKLSTDYFGKGTDGQTIQLPMPPMLVIAAANLPIEDVNLRSRLDQVEFPMPKQETLREYALKRFSIGGSARDNLFGTQKIRSFREIESLAPAYIDALEEANTTGSSPLISLCRYISEENALETDGKSVLRQRKNIQETH